MPTEMLAIGNTAAESAEFTLAAGDAVHLHIKGSIDGSAVVNVLVKDTGGGFTSIGQLTRAKNSRVLVAAGTYKLQRPARSLVGVDRD